MSTDLKVLADNRDALLLAEVGAWLHDMGKCSDEMLEWQALDKPQTPTFKNKNDYKTHFSYLLKNNNTFGDIILFGEKVKVTDLIEQGRPGIIRDIKKPWIIRALGRCHAAAHIEKENSNAKQKVNNTRLSNPFGFEAVPLKNLTNKLKNLPFNDVTNRQTFLNTLKVVFKNAPGDTRRPINEVNLWDWSSIVAALYKSALAGALLGNKPEPNKLKWRLLAIRFNSKQIWGNATNIPILNTRKEWLVNGLNNAKNLLEETYPLGNEVYRDENGSIFVVPDIYSLLEFSDLDNNKKLKELIIESLGYEGEIIVTSVIDQISWWGQNPTGHPNLNSDKIPPIAGILSKVSYSSADIEVVKKWWNEIDGRPEICRISWLRPQGPTQEGLQLKASDYWAKKIKGRAKGWSENPNTTIWIDEVADNNGRICLITGKIDISEWLLPDGHIETLLIKPPNGNSNDVFKKRPSFARIRRIWETTKEFWEDVERNLPKSIEPVEKRLTIIGNFEAKNAGDYLIKYSAYEAELDMIRFSIFCKDNQSGEYIIIENFQRLAKKLKMKIPSEQLGNYNVLVNYFNGKTLKVYNSEGKKGKEPLGKLKITQVNFEPESYTPAIPILVEPSTFMVMVPANNALKVVKWIKEKYEKEMGKVRNRLPVTLGMVFAPSHTPLTALMDAGRRMINLPSKEESWTLNSDGEICSTDCILNFNNGITWRVPIKMGDNTTDDIWYPYFYINGIPLNRSTSFKGPKGWLVHVKELKKGDRVKIYPSRFDFEFLDSASKRFEVSYNQNGKRRDDIKVNRPYLIEELDDFSYFWQLIEDGLARNQIKNIISLIEIKRAEWQVNSEKVIFKGFVHDVLYNANWKNGIPLEIEALEKAAISGKLKDIVELYMGILKVKREKK